MKQFQQTLARVLRRAESGEAMTFEFLVMLVPMMILMLMIGITTIFWGTRMPARRAATDCARVAIATLDAPTGIAQGTRIAQESLKGNNMNADTFHIDVFGDWNPGGLVTCTVRYNMLLPSDAIAERSNAAKPGAEDWFFITNAINNIAANELVVVEAVTLKVEPYKSDWK
jgi:hypothetical protein